MNVKLEKFEGPLGLLLKLIEKEEMDVTQISLAKIADEYVHYIRSSSTIQPEEMADFLVVAAKLLLIKSRALLPYLYPEEEAEMEELEQRLKMYKEYVDAAEKIEKILGKKKFMFPRTFNRKAILANADTFSPPKQLKAEDMTMVYEDLLHRLRPAQKLEEKRLEKKISIEDKILSIRQLIAKRIKFSFNRVLEGADNSTDVIVSFLAALELMRQREVRLEQEMLFGEIFVEPW
jgi:segregation and condensation protein A